ncbi:MAG: efflux RND transporter periplasmic adaptor subunit [Pirellulaceae bacterium]
MPCVLPVLTMALLAGQTSGDNRPGADEIMVPKSMVLLIEQNDLPARQAGVIRQMVLEDGTKIREGLTVKRGQVLGTLDDEDARARRRAVEAEQRVAIAEKGKADAGIVAAEATTQVAGAELNESLDIIKRAPGSVPATQIRRQELTVKRAASEEIVAKSEVETARLTIDAKGAQLDVATITLNQHRIVSALDGVIVEMYRQPGEWVSPGDPILRIVHMDRVRVQGFVDAKVYTPDQLMGREVEITVLLPQDRVEKFTSSVSFASPLVEAGAFRVYCDVPNRMHNGHWILRPGSFVDKMVVRLNSIPGNLAASR